MIVLAASTSPRIATEPTERSTPAVISTNVLPHATTVSTATFWAVRIRLVVVRKRSPAVIEKNATSTANTTSV